MSFCIILYWDILSACGSWCIATFEKIMLVNWGLSIKTIWAKDKIKCFKNGCLPGVVVADQNSVGRKEEFSALDASKAGP